LSHEGESKGKEPRRIHADIPHQILEIKESKPPRKSPRKGSKNLQKGKWEEHNQASRNHDKSSIHTMKVHTRSSLPFGHPSLSEDLNLKLSS
jgi:hypothetical protein